MVVDPQRDIHQYLADAGSQNPHIRRVFLTNFQADFLSGHLEFREVRVGSAGRAQDSWGDAVSRLDEMSQAAEELSHKRPDINMD